MHIYCGMDVIIHKQIHVHNVDSIRCNTDGLTLKYMTRKRISPCRECYDVCDNNVSISNLDYFPQNLSLHIYILTISYLY